MRRLISFLGFLALLAGPCPAAAQQWTPQLYVGVHGGVAFTDTVISDGPLKLDGVSSNGWMGGVHAGLDFPLMRPVGLVPFVGAFGGWDWGNVKTTISLSPMTTLTGSFGDSWYAGGRLGVMSGSGAKYYVLGAYRNTWDDFKELFIAVKELKGWDAGVGMSLPVGRYVELGLEGIYTRYDREDNAFGPHSPSIQPNTLGVMARLNFALGDPAKPNLFEDDQPVQHKPAPRAATKPSS